MNNTTMPDPNTLFQQAVIQHKSGNIDKAIEIYRLLKKQYPKNSQVLYMFGTAEFKRGNYLESLDLLGKSIKINPNSIEAHNDHGNTLKKLKRFDLALQSYNRAIQLKPDHPVPYINRGTALLELKHFEEALQSLDQSIQLNPGYLEAHINRGIALKELKRFDEALQSYDLALHLKPDYLEALINRGTVLVLLKRFVEALQSFDRAIQLNPDSPETHYNRGIALKELKRFHEALQSYNHALQLNPDYLEAYINRGIILKELNRFDEALQNFDQALRLNPHYPETHYNRGIVLQKLKRYDEALQSLDRALRLNPDHPETHYGRGNTLEELKRFDEALQSFDRALQLNPSFGEAHINRGAVLIELKRFDEAMQSFDRALQLDPDYMEAYINRGTALMELKYFDEAIQDFDRALQLNPDYPETHYNRGIALKGLKRFDEALQSFDRAIQLKPDKEYWLGMWFYLILGCCDWKNFDDNKNKILNSVITDMRATDPFQTLLLTDTLDILKQSAKIWVKDKCCSSNPAVKPTKYPRHDKIRLGYFSADYRDHPVSHLIAEMLELHDHSKFELYGFSFGPESSDPWRIRTQKCFDRFIDVRFMSDQEVSMLARDHQIDIAIDLMGFTADSRSNIFAGRAAPVQVNYLGYPGTMGAEFMDYIVADKTIIPETDRHHYTEKVVYLPDCYMATCRSRDVAQTVLTRAELDLPQDGFVFCCFNNTQKITPTMFDSWMRILRQVEDSVLWLFESNRWAPDNLRMEAEKRGVHADRLIFAKKLPRIEDHLNRISYAGLFLDTLPYNAHTTASDALRMGVPLVTLAGNAFAGRVAASLLKTLDLGELITHSEEEYEEIAVDLAINRDRLQRIKEKLNVNIQTSSLFDSALFTRHLERAYELMYERYRNDLDPDHIVV